MRGDGPRKGYFKREVVLGRGSLWEGTVPGRGSPREGVAPGKGYSKRGKEYSSLKTV
jgi:hypothetical protein